MRQMPPDWVLGERNLIDGIEVFWPRVGLLAHLVGAVGDAKIVVAESHGGLIAEIEVLDAQGSPVDGAIMRAVAHQGEIPAVIEQVAERLKWRQPIPGANQLARQLLRTPEQNAAWRVRYTLTCVPGVRDKCGGPSFR